MTELTLTDAAAETHVHLDPSGEHIVTRRTRGKDGFWNSRQLGFGGDDWAREVARAERAAAFSVTA